MKVFLYDAESDYEEQDTEMDLELTLMEFHGLSNLEGSFFGIKTGQETIQFAWEDQNKWLVDIPYDIEKRLNLQKFANDEECDEIIKTIFSGTPPTKIDNLVKVNIMESTLDEVLSNQ